MSAPAPGGDTVILSVRLASGDFESSLRVPLDAPAEDKNRAIMQWLALIQTALQIEAKGIEIKAQL